MNKVFNVCFVPFRVILYLILVLMSTPKKVKVYAVNLPLPDQISTTSTQE